MGRQGWQQWGVQVVGCGGVVVCAQVGGPAWWWGVQGGVWCVYKWAWAGVCSGVSKWPLSCQTHPCTPWGVPGAQSWVLGFSWVQRVSWGKGGVLGGVGQLGQLGVNPRKVWGMSAHGNWGPAWWGGEG